MSIDVPEFGDSVVPVYESDDPLVAVSDPNAQRVEVPRLPEPSTHTESLIIVIPVSRKKQAEAVAKNADPSTQGETFTVPLSATGEMPATHYWCGWTMTKAQRGRLVAIENAAEGQIFDMEEYTTEEVLFQLGLKRIESDFLV